MCDVCCHQGIIRRCVSSSFEKQKLTHCDNRDKNQNFFVSRDRFVLKKKSIGAERPGKSCPFHRHIRMGWDLPASRASRSSVLAPCRRASRSSKRDTCVYLCVRVCART